MDDDKIGVVELRNPWMDWHKTWRAWLHRQC